MADEQRCGACKWLKKRFPSRDGGKCRHPITRRVRPASLAHMWMSDNFGRDCPCFERKEARDGD